ncbi:MULTISPECIES: methyltransferase domain-containing protein [unclassified Polynucleobacter]|uniref:class I SAM-dependent methyltransferase n=1 Tax=unclassified Polynucleobacter TaxID=2640945 RepID=UPI0008C7D61D|nr:MULTISPECIES: methyltransferase domain-containing protein [unclassified Polynucleobacter]OHC09456.1 MAG: SAM-dependent methyltransferase [Polynucleobacter sp. GWA2_45_21]HBK43856.1 SAM-dependent methyltransferase [Polynucleobacter sp.]
MTSHEVITAASPWVRRFAQVIPKDGRVLDLACGAGRHTALLASLGHQILAVDQDISALEPLQISSIQIQALDLEGSDWPLLNQQFSAIVVTNYLYRPFLDQLPKMLTEGGVLIYETFADGNAEFGKPSNPNFLLKPGELLALAQHSGLKVIAYEDIYLDQPKPAMVQRICAVKGHLKGYVPLQFGG